MKELKWEKVGEGSYKTIFKTLADDASLLDGSTYKGPWVKQIPHRSCSNANKLIINRDRQVRLLKLINPDWQDKVGFFNDQVVAPLVIHKREATDEERANLIIEVYRKTGRLILDIANADNVLFDETSHSARAVDIDVAVGRNSPASNAYIFYPREGEETLSPRAWANKVFNEELLDYWDLDKDSDFPQSIKTIKRLCRLIQTFDEAPIPDSYLEKSFLNVIDYTLNKPLSDEELHIRRGSSILK